MATLKMVTGCGKNQDEATKNMLIIYTLDAKKMPHRLAGSFGIDSIDVVESMNKVSAKFGGTSGAQLRHFIISFAPDELDDPLIADEIGFQTAMYLAYAYQAFYAVHEDKSRLHIHIIMNSVSYIDGHRYYGGRKEFNQFKAFLARLLRRFEINSLIYVSNKQNNDIYEDTDYI